MEEQITIEEQLPTPVALNVDLIPPGIRALLATPWSIERSFAMQSLGRYLSNLEALRSDASVGTSFERLKALSAPAVIDMQGNVHAVGPAAVMRGHNIPAGSVMRLNLMGPMMSEGDLCSWGMYDYEEAIALANTNPNISGILIRANTGGGESMAGQILHNAVKSSDKPVVVFAELLASAGIHGTLAADEIIASGPASRFGSIGTYAAIDKEMVQWYRDNVEEIYAEGSEDKNREWRDYLAGDPTALRKSVTENAKLFRAEVAKYRQLNPTLSEQTLRGGMFTAQDAKRRGLIDGVGDMSYAIKRLQAHMKHKTKRRG